METGFGGYSSGIQQREKADQMTRQGRNLSAFTAGGVPVSCVCLPVYLHSLQKGVLPEPEAGDGAAELHLSDRDFTLAEGRELWLLIQRYDFRALPPGHFSPTGTVPKQCAQLVPAHQDSPSTLLITPSSSASSHRMVLLSTRSAGTRHPQWHQVRTKELTDPGWR